MVRTGARAPLSIGSIIVAVGCILATLVGIEGSYWSTTFPAVLAVSLGMGAAVAPLTTAVLASVEMSRTGVASGLNSAIARTGGLIATALLSAVLAAHGTMLVSAYQIACMFGAGAQSFRLYARFCWCARPARGTTAANRSIEENSMQTPQADYFAAYRNLKLSRDDKGVLVAEFHSDGGHMTAQSHTEFVDAFHRIGQDRANKIVIITGAGGNFIGDVEWPSFGDVADPGVWSRIHDEGVQVLENIANIRVPVIAAVEGRAHIHSDYALLANVIVAAEGATFQDVGHFAVGVTPGDGIFTTWSYRAGPGRAEAFLLNPQPLPARTAYEWGVVAEVVANGKAVARARELADLYLRVPEVTCRNTRVHFIQGAHRP